MFMMNCIGLRLALFLLPLLMAGCGGLQEVWEGPGAKVFRPQAMAVPPPMASQYDTAREDIQEVLAGAFNPIANIERVTSPERLTEHFAASKAGSNPPQQAMRRGRRKSASRSPMEFIINMGSVYH